MVHTPALPAGVTAQDVANQLERILASAVFQRSERLRRFLHYSVTASLNGRAVHVNEYAIGLEVFDKSQNFDSRNDPVVRVEAGRLRAKIREYYATAGAGDSLFVGIRDRGYLPVIRTTVPGNGTPEGKSNQDTRPCVAVPTFHDLSLEGAQRPFCEALTHRILQGLIKEQGLTVVSRTVSSRLNAGVEDFLGAARELAVDYIVEGSVQRYGDQVRIMAELSDTKTGRNLWSQSMDHPVDDILLLQEAVASEVLKGLRSVLLREEDVEPDGEEEEQRIGLSKGYAHFVRGQKAWSSGAVKDLQISIENFETAGRRDPDFSAAWAGLANARIALALTRTTPPGSLMREAKTAAYRALVADKNLAEAHAAKGMVEALCEFNHDAARESFKCARGLDSKLPLIDQWHALAVLLPSGDIAAASKQIAHAQRAQPTSILLHYHQGVLKYLQGQYQEAAEILKMVIELEPEYESAHLALGDAYFFLGREQEALERYARVKEIAVDSPSCWKSAEAFVHAMSGKRSEAKRLLKRLLLATGTGYSWPYEVACVYAALDEEETAVEWLERAREDGVPTLAWLQHEPKFERLRKHPKCAEFLTRLGLQGQPVPSNAG